MINVQFSSNNANNQIRRDNYIKKDMVLISNNFKCNNKADNKIKPKKTIVTLGKKAELWD